MLPDVLTVAQLAELLDCTAETVEDRTRDRTLPGLKFGRSWIYPREAVLEVLRQQALAHVRAVASQAAPMPTPKVPPLAVRPPQRARRHSPPPLPDPPISAQA